MSIMDVLGPVVVALVYISLSACSGSRTGGASTPSSSREQERRT